MSARAWGKGLAAVGLLGLVMVLAACQALYKTPAPQPAVKGWKPARLAVFPFERVVPDRASGGLATSPLTGAVYAPGPIAPDAEQSLDNALAAQLPQVSDSELVTGRQVWGALSRNLGRGLQPSLRLAVAKAGRELKVDAVLIGFIYRFRQRVGPPFAAEKPASVAFDLNLVRSRDGSVVWKGSFDHTQQSLSENILQLDEYAKHGVRWLSAQDYGRFGLGQILAEYPWPKAGK